MMNQPTIQDLRVLAARIVERISQCSAPMRGVPFELSDRGIAIRLETLDGSIFVDGAIQICFGVCGGRYEGGIAAWLGGWISPGPERVALLPDEFHRIDDFIREAVRIRSELCRDIAAEATFVAPEKANNATVTLPGGSTATVADVLARIEKLETRSKGYRAEAAAELELYSKGRWPDGKPVGHKERLGCFDNAADLEVKADHEEGVARNLRRLVDEVIAAAKPIAASADSPQAASTTMNFDFAISQSSETNRLQIVLADARAEDFCKLHTVNRVGGRRDASGATTHFVFPPEVEADVRAAVARGQARYEAAPPVAPAISEGEWKAAEEEARREHAEVIERFRLGLDRQAAPNQRAEAAQDNDELDDDRLTNADDPEAVYCAWAFIPDGNPFAGPHDLGGWLDDDHRAFERLVRAKFAKSFELTAHQFFMGVEPSSEVNDLLDAALGGIAAEVSAGRLDADGLREMHPAVFVSAFCDGATPEQRRLLAKLLKAELADVRAELAGGSEKATLPATLKLIGALLKQPTQFDGSAVA